MALKGKPTLHIYLSVPAANETAADTLFKTHVGFMKKTHAIGAIGTAPRLLEYSIAKDKMFEYTDTKASPWWVVDADDKRRARLNCIRHILDTIPYADVDPPELVLPPMQEMTYLRPPIGESTHVKDYYAD